MLLKAVLGALVVKARFHVDQRFELDRTVPVGHHEPVGDEPALLVHRLRRQLAQAGRVLLIGVGFVTEVAARELRRILEHLAGQFQRCLAIAEHAGDLGLGHPLGAQQRPFQFVLEPGRVQRDFDPESFFRRLPQPVEGRPGSQQDDDRKDQQRGNDHQQKHAAEHGLIQLTQPVPHRIALQKAPRKGERKGQGARTLFPGFLPGSRSPAGGKRSRPVVPNRLALC